MQTTLNLLTRDGAVYMAFQPALNAQQYAELWEISHKGTTGNDLRDAVRQWARQRGLKLSLEESQLPS